MSLSGRSAELFREHERSIHVRTDRLFAWIMAVQWLGAIITALVISPRSWAGSQFETHTHVYAAILLGGAIVSLPIALAVLRSGTPLTRHAVAVGQMLMSALLIHLTGGRIETHFHVFGSLAFLAFYRDWSVLLSASLIVGADHYLRGAFWPQSVYGVAVADQWRWLEHVWWVLFEDVFLVMAIRQSISEMHAIAERQARIEGALAEAERASQLKDEFLATLSHELRTPLTSLFGWIEILRRPETDAATAKRGLGVLDRSTRALMRLIDDLLDVSRIVAGKFVLETRPTLLSSVVESAVETIRPAAAAKDIRLTVELRRKDLVLQGDAPRLQQVIWNLLSNAVKFTPKNGAVRVRLDEREGGAVLTVSDNGRGIPQEFLPHVFQRFRQADGSITRSSGGLGLGLAIVRHIVDLHGGTVTVSSGGAGAGSEFTVTLPLIQNAVILRDSTLNVPVQSSRMLDGLTVLVVEDEIDSRELITLVLQRSGARVLCAASATEALALIENDRPHVMISDIGMPSMDGYALIKKVREREAQSGGHLPAAALTAYAKSDDRARALAAGFEEHVSKPIEPEMLPRFVAQLAKASGVQAAQK